MYGVSLKDRSAILPSGFAANAAFWIDHNTGALRHVLLLHEESSRLANTFNASGHVKKYLDSRVEGRGRQGDPHHGAADEVRTAPTMDVYYRLGNTPFANDYTLELARELVVQEKLGTGPATDLLIVSFSAPDVLGHDVGPDSPEHRAMLFALDRQLAEFFSFMGRAGRARKRRHRIDGRSRHRTGCTQAQSLRIPAEHVNPDELRAQGELGHVCETQSPRRVHSRRWNIRSSISRKKPLQQQT